VIEVTVSVDTAKAERLLADFPQALAEAQRNALKAIGAEVASSATRAFRSEPLRPSPWAPRKKLGDGHPLLIKSGALRQSIGWKLEGSDTVVVGTDKKYAAYHQHGTKHMPARPMFPVDKDGRLTPRMLGKVRKLAEAALNKALGGAAP